MWIGWFVYGVLEGFKVEGDTHTHTPWQNLALDKLRELVMFWLGPYRLEFPGVGTWFVQVLSSLRSHKNIDLDSCTHSFQKAAQNRALCSIMHL